MRSSPRLSARPREGGPGKNKAEPPVAGACPNKVSPGLSACSHCGQLQGSNRQNT